MQGCDALVLLDQYFKNSELPALDQMRPLQCLAVKRYNEHRPRLQELAQQESLPQNQMLFQLHRLLKALFSTNNEARGK